MRVSRHPNDLDDVRAHLEREAAELSDRERCEILQYIEAALARISTAERPGGELRGHSEVSAA